MFQPNFERLVPPEEVCLGRRVKKDCIEIGCGSTLFVWGNVPVDCAIEPAEKGSPNPMGGCRDQGFQNACYYGQGQAGQRSLHLVLEETDQCFRSGQFIFRNGQKGTVDGVVLKTTETLSLSWWLCLDRLANQTQTEGHVHNVIKSSSNFGVGWSMKKDVVHMNPDQQAGLPILTN